MLCGPTATLRGLRHSDAASLFEHLTNEHVLQYIAQAPASVEGFRRFIRWTQRERGRGMHLCFGLVPPGETAAVGILQLWPIEPDFSTSEWGFAVGHAYWGTGLFLSGARLLLDFAFGALGVERLEARAVEANERGNASLGKLGARAEGTLRHGFRRGDAFHNQVMWSILSDDWTRSGDRPIS